MPSTALDPPSARVSDPPGLAVLHVDLADGLPELRAPADGRDLYVVVWWRDVPLGHIELNARGLPARVLADVVAHRIARVVAERSFGSRLPSAQTLLSRTRPLAGLDRTSDLPRATTGAVRVTLAVCTRGRPRELERCLASVRTSSGGWSEIVVVDNAPCAQTREVVDRFPEAVYVAEPRRGLSAARNAAVHRARGDVLAFVDDDTVVHPAWLVSLCQDFADPRVMAVTGLVVPLELDTATQVTFEKALGYLGRGYRPAAFGPRFFARTKAGGVPVWQIGAGANMALRMAAFELVGPFDERLGAGAAGCSEDSELWYRLLAEGWECRYQPASVVFHDHRRDATELHRQVRDYMRGHVAGLFVQFAGYRHWGNLRRALLTLPSFLLREAARNAAGRALDSAGVTTWGIRRPAAAELVGYARGLAELPLTWRPRPTSHKAPLSAFLRANPYPKPLTEGFFYREKMRAIHRVAPDGRVERVLEVGGGQSGMARILYPEGHVTTADRDEQYASSPLNQGPRVRFIVADATDLPFADASFDVVTLLDVLEHIPDDRAAASEALRVVRPGGWVIVTSPNLRWRSPYHRLMRLICPSSAEMMERWGHVRRGYALEHLAWLFGAPPAKTADFINPVTAVGHDIAFSRLAERPRRALLWALSPVTWLGYALQPWPGRGTETAASWRKPPSR